MVTMNNYDTLNLPMLVSLLVIGFIELDDGLTIIQLSY